MKRHLSWMIMGSICLCMVLLNVLARLSTPFSDWYADTIFPVLSGLWSGLTGAVPFSVGEVLLVIGVLALVLVPVSFLVLMLSMKPHRRLIRCIYGQVVGWVLTWILSVESLHFFLLYHTTPFGDRYYPDASDTYSNAEVLAVYEALILDVNEAAKNVARDENGQFILTDDLQTEAKAAMQKLGETYPRYSGNYPDAKPIYHSFFMTQQYLLGVYFPFSMEANYNPDVCPANLPNTLCHEFSHLKGNMYEDEAGFLAFLACTGSDSADFRYSGYLNALEYMMDAGSEADADGTVSAQIAPEVWADLFEYVPENYWEDNAEQEFIPTETVQEVASAAIDTSLKINGVEDGEKSYGRIVNLLLDYYLQEREESHAAFY
ncbi:MAG: DUF3810 domain-containing protein [Oscillospiraceae bacterium]|nr:DUF3810 domain-containing protein [Oscillospiraceae bacterium]